MLLSKVWHSSPRRPKNHESEACVLFENHCDGFPAKTPVHWAMASCCDHFLQMAAYIKSLEERLAEYERVSMTTKTNVGSKSSSHTTYKVKSFELAAKLAASDGTDDGLYKGLPIEVSWYMLVVRMKAGF